jgi:hypothetical protein
MKVLRRLETINNYNVFNRKEAQHPLQVSRLFKQKTSIPLNRHLNPYCDENPGRLPSYEEQPAGVFHYTFLTFCRLWRQYDISRPIYPLKFGSYSTIHSIPYLSLNMPA